MSLRVVKTKYALTLIATFLFGTAVWFTEFYILDDKGLFTSADYIVDSDIKMRVLHRPVLFAAERSYTLQTLSRGQFWSSWKTLLIHEQDDPISARDKRVFIDGKLGYAYFGTQYAITKDGGSTWTIRDLKLQQEQHKVTTSSVWIYGLNISQEGTGLLEFREYYDKQEHFSLIKTEDYGETWNK